MSEWLTSTLNSDTMMKIEVIFTAEEAVSLFREAGLTVEIQDVEYHFDAPHRPDYTESIPTWVVVNPHTQVAEPLDKMFRKYIAMKQKELFLTAEKLQIFNLFEK